MAQEDQTPKCSNTNGGGGGGCGGSGGGGRSSKKQKPKKVPQRGLGVAQLEKIRLEEQQKKDASSIVLTTPPPPPPIPPKPSYSSVMPIFNYNPSNQSTNSTGLLSRNWVFTLPQSVEIPSPNTVPLVHSLGWQSGPVPGFVNGSKAWNCRDYYDLDNETSSEVDPGLAFQTNSNLPHESTPIWPLPSMIQRAQQFLQPPSMQVNASSRNSASSLLNFQIEPPSNQIYYGKYTAVPAMWPEDEKMVGMRRPYQFSMDNHSCPHSFLYKSPVIAHSISSKSDESSNSDAFCFEPGNHGFREGPAPCSAASFSEPDSKKCNRSNGDFLSLAPPSPYLASQQSHELPDFGSLPYQENVNDPMLQPPRPSPGRSYRLQQPYYSFFPLAMAKNGQETSTINGGSEVGESLDLNLKL
ncbi:uncharacterized protein LOC119986166 isoform X1 [Tripterygium wilfordii]|uniref:uncharacterized protein LOC119986166 isoform X1 n=1 Tax=Tripterygium wilfordii TaxID=458696 RepID=UPI0018F863CE|nr:uncharacterized protein LOC119986166 isoform X1 [Tripterygium wilfordii]